MIWIRSGLVRLDLVWLECVWTDQIRRICLCCMRLDWAGICWSELDWIAFDFIRLGGSVGLKSDEVDLDSIGFGWVGLANVRLDRVWLDWVR